MLTIRNSITFFTALLLGLGLITLSACETGYRAPQSATTAPGDIDPADQAATQKNIVYPPSKVALLLPLSGPHAELGQSMLNAAQIALFDVGHSNFELIPRDTQGTESGAAQAARAAIENGAELILGPVFAPAVRGAKPVAARARVNMIAFSTDWTLAGDNTFIMGFLPFDQVERVSIYAARRGLTRVGVLMPRNSYGQIVSRKFSQTAPALGMHVVDVTSYSPQSNNLAPVIRDFTSRGPYDAVLMPAGGDNARAIGSLLSHNNLPPRSVVRIGTGLLDDPALATESNLEGALFAAPPPDKRRSFERKYLQTFSERPPRLTTLAYDATALAATLARRGYEQRRKPFSAAAIKNPNGFAGIDGIFRFRDNGTAERSLAILTFQRGSIQVLEDAPVSFNTRAASPAPRANTAPSAATPSYARRPAAARPSAYRQSSGSTP